MGFRGPADGGFQQCFRDDIAFQGDTADFFRHPSGLVHIHVLHRDLGPGAGQMPRRGLRLRP
jgi:hypothetical protein